MDFQRVIKAVVGDLEQTGVRYALIGGFAMALRGVQRATMDLDFILSLEDMAKADAILARHGYRRAFHSENVSHYLSPDRDWGRIDILHAFRLPSLGMLRRAETMVVDEGLSLRVAQAEDIIGLKIQAAVNDATRAEDDWQDIRRLIGAAAEQGRALDWELVADYLRIFRLEAKLGALKAWHGKAD